MITKENEEEEGDNNDRDIYEESMPLASLNSDSSTIHVDSNLISNTDSTTNNVNSMTMADEHSREYASIDATQPLNQVSNQERNEEISSAGERTVPSGNQNFITNDMSRAEYMQLIGQNRLWRMTYFPFRQRQGIVERMVETQSLASRALHLQQKHSDSLSFNPSTSYYGNRKLLNYCREHNWEEARLRAISHPHEANPATQFLSHHRNVANNRQTDIETFSYKFSLSVSPTRSTNTTALAVACRYKAPIETVRAIIEASPIQLRYPRRVDSTCYGTPLHEAIGVSGGKSNFHIIEYLITADEKWNSNIEVEGNYLNGKAPSEVNFKGVHATISVGKGKSPSIPNSEYRDNHETLSQQNQKGESSSLDNYEHQRMYGEFFFLQKSTRRRDSRGRTALHRWLDRVLGLYTVSTALPSLFSDSDFYYDSDDNDGFDQVSSQFQNTATHIRPNTSNADICLDPSSPINYDREIQNMQNDSEVIGEVTQKLINSYPQASALADRSGKTPLSIALQWEPTSLIRHLRQRRRRLLQQQQQQRLHQEQELKQQQEQQQEQQLHHQKQSKAQHQQQTQESKNTSNTNNETQDESQYNLHIQKLIKQMEHRITKIVQIMVEAYPPSVSVPCSSFGCTPLHHAIMHKRNMVTIQILLKASPESTQITSNIGELALHTAASMAAPLNLLELILSFGPTAASKLDRGGRTALHWIWIRYIIAATSPSSLTPASSTPTSLLETNGDATSTQNHSAFAIDTSRMFPKVIAPVSASNRRTVPNNWSAMKDAWLNKLKEVKDSEKARDQLINSSFWKIVDLLLRAVHCTALAKNYPHPTLNFKDSKIMLIHTAIAASCPRSLLRLVLMLYPSSVNKRDEYGRLPIHIAVSSPTNSLWRFDGKETSVVELLLSACPETAEVADFDDRLPIHLAVDFVKKQRNAVGRKANGGSIHGNVKTLLNVCPQSLSTKDGKRHGMLCPFMLAGCGNDGNLNLCYELLRLGPEAVSNSYENHYYYDVHEHSHHNPVQKRQRLP